MSEKFTALNGYTENDGKKTFLGVLETYYEEVAHAWGPTTRKQYNSDYRSKILPQLSGDNSVPIEENTKEDFDTIIDKIRQDGYTQNRQKKQYSEASIRHFQILIEAVVSAAVKNGICKKDVLWGSSFKLPVEDSTEQEIKKRIKLKRSFTIDQEWNLNRELFTDIKQEGEKMGLLLMFALGLRNGEACAIDFGAVRPMRMHPECKALWIYKSTVSGTNIEKSSGKTGNADRIIPVPKLLEEFILARRRYIKEQMASESPEEVNIDSFPIACTGQEFRVRCSARRLTEVCKDIFQKINIDEDQLSFIEDDLNNSHESSIEKIATAYLLRRNFATHLSILGLKEPEIEYVIGHDIEDAYESRNEFVNEEKLYEIKCKLDQRPIFNDSYYDDKTQELPIIKNRAYTFEGNGTQKYKVQVFRGQLKIELTSKEPFDTISVAMSSERENSILKEVSYSASRQTEYSRTINILSKYHELYSKEK